MCRLKFEVAAEIVLAHFDSLDTHNDEKTQELVDAASDYLIDAFQEVEDSDCDCDDYEE